MAISSDLILEPGDIDRVVFQCKVCRLRVEVSLAEMNKREGEPGAPAKIQRIPPRCSICDCDWADVQTAVALLNKALIQLKGQGVKFRLTPPEASK